MGKKCAKTQWVCRGSICSTYMRKEGLSQWVVHEFVFLEEVASKKQAARYNKHCFEVIRLLHKMPSQQRCCHSTCSRDQAGRGIYIWLATKYYTTTLLSTFHRLKEKVFLIQITEVQNRSSTHIFSMYQAQPAVSTIWWPYFPNFSFNIGRIEDFYVSLRDSTFERSEYLTLQGSHGTWKQSQR